jgi:hypothetical protein
MHQWLNLREKDYSNHTWLEDYLARGVAKCGYCSPLHAGSPEVSRSLPQIAPAKHRLLCPRYICLQEVLLPWYEPVSNPKWAQHHQAHVLELLHIDKARNASGAVRNVVGHATAVVRRA